MRKLALRDEILLSIEKPARYIGNEVNAVMKDAGTWTSALPCASRMSMRLVCPIWVFRFCMICSTNGRMSGVSVSIPRGQIWMQMMREENRFRCLPWSPRIRSRILTFLESRSSMRCVIPTFYRFWILAGIPLHGS